MALIRERLHFSFTPTRNRKKRVYSRKLRRVWARSAALSALAVIGLDDPQRFHLQLKSSLKVHLPK